MKKAKRILSAFTACALALSLVGAAPALAEAGPSDGFSLAAEHDTLTAGGSTRLILDQAGTQAIQSVEYDYDAAKVTVDESLGTISLKEGYTPAGQETVRVTANITYYDPDDVIFSDSFEGDTKTFTKGGKEASYAHSGTNAHWGQKAATPVANVVGPAQCDISDSASQYGTVSIWYYDTADMAADEVKFTFEVNRAGSSGNHAIGVNYDGSVGSKEYYVTRSGPAVNFGWNVTSIPRTQGWHQFRWEVTESGTKGYIGDTEVFSSDSVKTIEYLSLMTNWNNKQPGDLCDKLFVDDVTVVKPGADANVKTAQASVDLALKPAVEYTQTGATEAAFNKAAPSEVKTAIAPAGDLSGLKVMLKDSPLALNDDYTVDGGDVIFSRSYLEGLALGEYAFTLTIDGFAFPFTVTVMDTTGTKNYYFSNVTGDDATGDGTEPNPWKSLEKLNSLTLNPGDTVYLDAKSVWVGQIKITDSGAPGMPITLTKYNDGGLRDSRPIVNAGPVVTAETAETCTILKFSQGGNPAAGALEIRSASYVTVRGLELTNDGGEANKDRIKGRNGILVVADLAEDTTDGTYSRNWDASYQTNIHIDDCYVHDVNSNPSFKMAGGINFFGNIDNILVENCKAVNCDVEGIRNAGLYNKNNSWPAVHTVTFRNNYISGSAGDGMVISNALNSTISGNVVTDCGDSSLTTANYANLWLIGAKNTVVEYNEVFNNNHDRCNDGEAFDFDYNCEDSIYQYNYTHHNAGGVILFMGTPKNNVFRYNISVEDGSTSSRPHLFFYAGAGSTSTAPYIYNNVFIVGEKVKTLFDDGGSKSVFFYNNILLSVNGNVPQFTNSSLTSGFIRNNIIYPKTLLNSGIDGGVTVEDNYFVNPQLAGPGEAPENVMTGVMTGEAKFDLSMLQGYKLLDGSPAIDKGAEVALPRNIDKDRPVTHDFFGNALSGAPDVGVHEWSSDAPDQTVFEVLLTGIEVGADKTELKIGETVDLALTPTPYNAWNSGVNWTSSNADVVSVDLTGRVSAVGSGSATVTATALADGSITDTVDFKVKELPHLDHFRVKTEHNYILDAEGGKIQLDTVGVDQFGNDFFVAPADIKNIAYTASAGTVDALGVLTVPANTRGDVTVSAKVTMQNYDYYESFESGSSLTGGDTALVRTMDANRACEGDWSMVTRNNGDTDDDAIKDFGEARQGTVTIMYYDTAGKTARKPVSVSLAKPGGDLNAMGVFRDGSGSNYSYRIGSSWKDTGVARSTGYHEFKWVFSDDGLDMFIDGTKVAHDASRKTYRYIDVMSRAGWTQSEHNGYFGVDAIKAWTADSGTTDHATANVTLKANPEGASEIYVTAPADAITVNYGTLQMSAQFLPAGEGDVIWSVTPIDGAASISETGLLTALSNGRVLVRADAKDGSGLAGEKVITITGSLVHAEGIQVTLVNGENPPTHDQEATQMVARFTPSNTGDKSVTWAISNPDGSETDLATIDQKGVMRSWKNGTVRVTATSKETPTVSGYLDVVISGQLIRAEHITVNGPSFITVNTSRTMTVSITPENVVDPSVRWSMTDVGGTEAAIDPATGVFTAGGVPGIVTVTATSQDGSNVSGSLQVTIEENYSGGSYIKPTPNPDIHIADCEGGTVNSKLNLNGSTTLTFVPDAGKTLLYVRVNGLAVKGNTYTVPKGEAASIAAVFGDADTDYTQQYADTAALPEYMADAVNYAVGAGLFQGVDADSFAPQANMSRAMFASVLARLCGADTSAYVNTFTDVPSGAWYEGSVAWASEMGFTTGVGANQFAPDRAITREELVTLVYRFARKAGVDVEATGGLDAFSDAAGVDAWATDAMAWAVGLGLINGKDGRLAPTDTITRVETAIILQRMATLLVKD